MSETAKKDLISIRDLLRYAVSRFRAAELVFGHGSLDAYDEAAYLILHTLHLPLDRLETFIDARLTAGERSEVLRIIDRRVTTRVPAAYLTGEAWLLNHRFTIDERVIVPRSFIAELLEEQLAPWVEDPDAVERVVDVCTGSGCLAILAALAFPAAQVDAVDLSHDALAVAARNVADYHLGDRIELLHSNLYGALKGRRYDIILSNPPYVDAAAMATLPPEYQHEPVMALAGGADGLDLVRTLIESAHEHLTEHGVLVVEIGHNRDVLEAAYPTTPFTWLDTQAGDEYVFLLHARDLPRAPATSKKKRRVGLQ